MNISLLRNHKDYLRQCVNIEFYSIQMLSISLINSLLKALKKKKKTG